MLRFEKIDSLSELESFSEISSQVLNKSQWSYL
jgi:hypothetical protein